MMNGMLNLVRVRIARNKTVSVPKEKRTTATIAPILVGT